MLNKQLDELDRAIRAMGKNHSNEDAVNNLEISRKEVHTRLTFLKPVDDRERTALQRNASLMAGIATSELEHAKVESELKASSDGLAHAREQLAENLREIETIRA